MGGTTMIPIDTAKKLADLGGSVAIEAYSLGFEDAESKKTLSKPSENDREGIKAVINNWILSLSSEKATLLEDDFKVLKKDVAIWARGTN